MEDVVFEAESLTKLDQISLWCLQSFGVKAMPGDHPPNWELSLCGLRLTELDLFAFPHGVRTTHY